MLQLHVLPCIGFEHQQPVAGIRVELQLVRVNLQAVGAQLVNVQRDTWLATGNNLVIPVAIVWCVCYGEDCCLHKVKVGV